MLAEKNLDWEKISQQITYRPKTRMTDFRSLPVSERSAVFNNLSPRIRQDILKHLSLDESVELLDHLDLRRAHYILDTMEDVSQRKKNCQSTKKRTARQD